MQFTANQIDEATKKANELGEPNFLNLYEALKESEIGPLIAANDGVLLATIFQVGVRLGLDQRS